MKFSINYDTRYPLQFSKISKLSIAQMICYSYYNYCICEMRNGKMER